MHFKHKMEGSAHLYKCCEVAGYACPTLLQPLAATMPSCCTDGASLFAAAC